MSKKIVSVLSHMSVHRTIFAGSLYCEGEENQSQEGQCITGMILTSADIPTVSPLGHESGIGLAKEAKRSLHFVYRSSMVVVVFVFL
jgi:hypothetical protein